MSIIRKVYNRLPNRVKNAIKNRIKKHRSLSKESLCKKLLKYDVISFDIFDTLITRRIYKPEDIYSFIGNELNDVKLKESLVDMRRKSEAFANKVKQHDVNIDEIYSSMMELYEYNENDINRIKNLEIEFEKKFTVPRKDMLYVLEYLVNHNKKVILTSDMYLNQSIVEDLLDICGYKKDKHYHEILLSNELNLRKDSGTMWEHIKEIYSRCPYDSALCGGIICLFLSR